MTYDSKVFKAEGLLMAAATSIFIKFYNQIHCLGSRFTLALSFQYHEHLYL